VLDDTPTLIARLTLLMEQSDHGSVQLGEFDATLTDGYAAALALEAEQRRLHADILRLAEAGTLDDSRLEELAGRQTRASRELAALRETLAHLRERRRAIRIAMAAG
jgi:hypothetical protein